MTKAFSLTRWLLNPNPNLNQFISNPTKKCCESNLLASKEPMIIFEVSMRNTAKILGGFALIFLQPFLKFGYSEKATNFEKIFHLNFDATQVEVFFKFCGLIRISKL